MTLGRDSIKMLLTGPLQLSDAGSGFVFGRKLDRPWLSPSGTADGHLKGFSRAKLPIYLGQLLKVVHGGKK